MTAVSAPERRPIRVLVVEDHVIVREGLVSLLEAQAWLRAGGLVYLEAPAGEGTPPLPARWSLHRSKRAGEVGYHLARAGDSGGAPAVPASS